MKRNSNTGLIRYYIASRLENAPRGPDLKAILDARGCWVHTYDWTVHGSVQNEGEEVIRTVARMEAHGVERADVVIVLLPGGRGTHVELGMAIGFGNASHILVLSESAEIDFGQDGRTCAFYHHSDVDRVSSWGALIDKLDAIEAASW